MNDDLLSEAAKNGFSIVNSSVSTIVGAIITTLFLRKNTQTTEFEKIKAGHFGEVINKLLDSGKMSYLEYYKCANFLDIAKLADEQLSNNEDKCEPNSSNDYSFDWFIRFFEAASNISNEEMKGYWASVLSREINNAGGFSLRTIDTLYNMTSDEAAVFEVISRIVLDGEMLFSSMGGIGQEINERYMYDNNALRLLEECGLINGLLMRNQMELLPGECGGFVCGKQLLLFSNDQDETIVLEYSSYHLTMVGRQIYSVIYSHSDENYLREIGLAIREKYPYLNVSLHPMNAKLEDNDGNEDSVSYDPDIDYLSEDFPIS